MCGPQNGVNFACVRSMGYLLIVTSILIIALTIADILVTYFHCSGNGENCIADPYPWTWVGSGIWTSIFVFVLGLWAIAWSMNMRRPGCFHNWFLNSIFFFLIPLMIALTLVEVVQHATTTTTTTNTNTTTSSTSNKRMWFNGQYDKLPIPITVVVLGVLEHAICFFIYIEIFCKQWSEEYEDVIENIELEPTSSTTPAATRPVAPVVTATSYPANVVYPNIATAARIRTALVPAYGIYSPKNFGVVQPQLTRWNQPAVFYAPRAALGTKF